MLARHLAWVLAVLREPPPPSPMETEIARVRAALRRHEAKVDAMSDEWARLRAPCCPGCMFGQEYTKAADKCGRTGRWLKILLRRRGRSEDVAEAKRLEMDYPG